MEPSETPRRKPKKQAALPPGFGKMQQPPPENPEETPAITFRPDLSSQDRDIMRLALRICHAYGARFRLMSGALKGRKSNYADTPNDPSWRAIAQVLRDNHIGDPERFIEAQFRYSAVCPINHLKSPEALVRYKKYAGEQRERMALTLSGDVNEFCMRTGLLQHTKPDAAPRMLWEVTLRDLTVRMSPLFRYCVAVSEGFDKTAAMFKDAAMQQFIADVAGYRQIWKNKIPDALYQEAEKLLNPAI